MKKSCLVFVLVLCCALLLAAVGCSIEATTGSTTTPPTETPGAWTNLSPGGDLPSARNAHSMVYDSDTGQVILFGGGGDFALNDTWAYDPAANTWTNLEPTSSLPSARSFQSMVYDSDTGRVILFGGHDGTNFLNDTWAYDPAANTWTNLEPSGDLPPARMFHSMVYDPAGGQVILFGGSGDFALNDTWAYDFAANTWTNLDPGGDLPPARNAHSMVYDSDTGQVILFGGSAGPAGDTYFDDTWAYDFAANTWTNLEPGGDPPSARDAQSMVYDSGASRVILFGGGADTYLNDTWAYDPSANTWTILNPGGSLPSARAFPTMVYDSAAGQVIIFGGSTGSAGDIFFDDTWAYGGKESGIVTTASTTTMTEETTTTTEAVTLNKWDAAAEVDGMLITVSEPVKDTSQFVEDDNGRRLDTFKVLTTKVVLENITSEPHIYAASYFMLADTEGGFYSGNDEDSVSYSKHTAMRSGYLGAGEKITRWVTFIVPVGAAAYSIEYSKDGSFGENIQALWQP